MIMIKEMKPDDLDNVSGGAVYYYAPGTKRCKYLVLDDETGEIVQSFSYEGKERAQQWAREHGYSDRLITSQEARMLGIKGPKTNLCICQVCGQMIPNPELADHLLNVHGLTS